MANIFGNLNLIPFTAGTTGATGTTTPILDMDGYEGVVFMGYQEATNTSNQLVARGGSATASLTEYVGEASGITGSLYLNVFRPSHRYIEGYLHTSGAAGNTVLTGFRYGARKLPATNSTLWNGTELSSPVTGTATG